MLPGENKLQTADIVETRPAELWANPKSAGDNLFLLTDEGVLLARVDPELCQLLGEQAAGGAVPLTEVQSLGRMIPYPSLQHLLIDLDGAAVTLEYFGGAGTDRRRVRYASSADAERAVQSLRERLGPLWTLKPGGPLAEAEQRKRTIVFAAVAVVGVVGWFLSPKAYADMVLLGAGVATGGALLWLLNNTYKPPAVAEMKRESLTK
ncbi:MAG: hypothetical protein ACRC1K_05380 [Planctomycetia bacterium]